MKEINKKQLEIELIDIKKRVLDAILVLKLDEKESELDVLEEESKSENFWSDQDNAQKIMQKINTLKEIINPWRKIEKEVSELLEIISDTDDSGMIQEIEKNHKKIEEELKTKEIDTYYSGKYDEKNAVLSIYAGAGGVDAQDWAEMLLSMFLKFAEKKNLKTKIISVSPGNEAGLKSVSVEIEGNRSYGVFKSESGVHRLVRISPFDADKARHTSFALVEVIPEVESSDVKINDKDLKIDTFKASGHGGQSVNTTDSAVRITHVPTNTVVSCQNERSQLQNKEQALKILKARLGAAKEAEKDKEIRLIKGENLSAEWGSQIRSYVMQPYTMVKDHRTNAETSNVEKVLAGDLDLFVEAFLKNSK
ncbi:MAG: peptide chain release factor 2 [Patescibacteria group bacterium]|nr:peptide chain release factor 2 [Patescibacteria group bacterium]